MHRKLNQLAGLFVDFPYSSLKDQVGINPRNQRIPPTVIQTWEENSFGKRHIASMQKFRSINRDLSFQILDASERADYMKSLWGAHPIHEIYTRAKFGPLKADIFRYCFVYTHGGYYVDISKGFNCSLTELHDSNSSEMISFEGNLHTLEVDSSIANRLLRPSHLCVQWAFGFVSGHPILRYVIESIVYQFPNYENKLFPNPKAAILKLTGPEAFTLAIHAYLGDNPDVSINQLDYDFDGHGIYALNGAGARHRRYPSYELAQNSLLFEKSPK